MVDPRYDTRGRKRLVEVEMRRISVSEEDAEHIRNWQKLSPDAKEALNRIAEFLEDKNKRRSFYELVEAQVKISNLLTTFSHLGFIGQLIVKAGLIASIILSIGMALKLYFGWFGGK